MSISGEPSALANGEGPFISSSSGAAQTLTVYSPTVVSTTFVPGTTLSSSLARSDAAQSTPSFSNDDNNANGIDDGSDNSNIGQSSGGGRTTVIVLATTMSVLGFLLLAGILFLVIRCRRRRSSLFARGITPIGDDEIETWKGQRTEKGLDMDMERPLRSPTRQQQQQQHHHHHADEKGHQKSESTTSIRKPPSVIVYARPSEEFSPISPTHPFTRKISIEGGLASGTKRSFDKDLPFTPIQARAPNAREGLTDEAIPGDEPFVGNPKRRGSRLSKQISRHPFHGGGGGGGGHTRNKSSRSSSSLHRLGGGGYGYESDDYHRPSHDTYFQGGGGGHSRVSSTQDPPRLSLSDEWPGGAGSAGLSPRPFVRAEDIGRAIG